MSPPLLGAHVSAAGGLPRAIPRAVELGCDTTQVFVKSPHQWSFRDLPPAEVEAFRTAVDRSDLRVLVAHATYLVNLAATDREILERSRVTLGLELDRCDALGIDALVVHPGSHRGAGPEAGLRTIADSLERVLESRPRPGSRLLLETTAGQGTTLGRSLEELAWLLDRLGRPPSLGVCLDTCHLFAAGYRVHEAAGYEAFTQELDRRVGAAVGCVHLNDSRHPCGSARDRHANLGDGEIGLAPFARFLADRRFSGLPLILETPSGEDRTGHRRDLERLRSLAAGSRRAIAAGGPAPDRDSSRCR